MKKFAIIVAGGFGARMNNSLPKQFLLLNNKPVLWYSIDAFFRAYDDVNIILVLHDEFMERGKQIASLFNKKEKINFTNGGITRFHSVQNGLKLVDEESVVFVHDAVRCLVSVSLIQRCCKQALAKGSAIPAVAATDSIRIIKNDKTFVEDRRNIRIIQTPQTFLSSIILPAFDQEFIETFTDEATVVEAFGTEIFLTEGEYDNIKITRPIDLLIAEKILEEKSSFQ